MWSVFLPHPQDPHSLPYLPTPTGRWSLHCFATDGPWPRETVFARTKDCGISKIKGGFTPKSRSQKMKYCNWFEVKSIIWLIFNQPLYIKSVSISLDHVPASPKKSRQTFQSAFSPPKNFGLHDLGLLGCSSWSGGRTLGGSLTNTGASERSLEPWGLEKPICWGSVPLLKEPKKESHTSCGVAPSGCEPNCGKVWKLWVILMPWT